MDQRDREMLVRIDENVHALKKAVFGNGTPGLVSRVQAVETSHQDCMKRQHTPKQWPAVVSAICAVVAVIWGLAK